MRPIRSVILNIFTAAVCASVLSLAIAAQSTDPSFPAPVTTNEIQGTIKARDIGDPRVTSYFYTFDGGQGDVFINAVTKNFTGDIDVFAAEGLRSLAKMVIYADAGPNETGRLVYMRKPERLILRVQGRTVNDDPASFDIKFAGSFVALAPEKPVGAPAAVPEVDAESGIRVNSVGTIVEILPKPQPPSKQVEPVKHEPPANTEVAAKATRPTKAGENVPPPVTGGETVTAAKKSAPPAKSLPPGRSRTIARKVSPPTRNPAGAAPDTVFRRRTRSSTATVVKKPAAEASKPAAIAGAPDPMANIHLMIQLKDGTTVQRPMSEVTKFGVDNGVLTVTTKDGNTVIYSIFAVAKVTIE